MIIENIINFYNEYIFQIYLSLGFSVVVFGIIKTIFSGLEMKGIMTKGMKEMLLGVLMVLIMVFASLFCIIPLFLLFVQARMV